MADPVVKLPNFSALSPDEYKHTGGGAWNILLFQQLSLCMYTGSVCGTDKESLRKFERSVKMLEATLISKLNEKYKERIKKAIEEGIKALKRNDYNAFYESLRLRYMYLMQVLANVPNFMPEEKAIEEISLDEKEENADG